MLVNKKKDDEPPIEERRDKFVPRKKQNYNV